MSYLKNLESALKKASNPKEAQVMAKYMRNQFTFYGVRAPIARELFKEHISVYGLPESFSELILSVKKAWKFPAREMQYIGMYLVDKSEKIWDYKDMEDLFEHMITNLSWWDTVDYISSSLVHQWWIKNPEFVDKVIAPKWNYSNNMWLNRTSIIYKLRRRKQTDTKILSDHILKHAQSKEFFLQKAIGWALREYAKINKDWVLQFVAQHDLKPLSKREALKQIKAGKIKKPW